MKEFLSIVFLSFSSLMFAGNEFAKEIQVVSPDQCIKFIFNAKNDCGLTILSYKVNYKNEPIILDSRMGIEMENSEWESAIAYSSKVKAVNSWCDNLIQQGVVLENKERQWKPVYGERSLVNEAYHGAVISFLKDDKSNYKMDIEVRVFNEGVAFRYIFPMHPDALFNSITEDKTEYTVPEGTKAWCARWAQAPYKELAISDWETAATYERALTLHLPSGKWAALTDADTDNWCLTNFVRSETKVNTIATNMYSRTDMVTPYATPWKIILLAETAGELLENNDIVLNLNSSCEIADTNWIKPGKIMRSTVLGTQEAMECIDFCEQHNMQYILFDWKWYGPAFDYASDATKVIPEIDMRKVVAYGKSKNIGVWLYVNHHALEKQALELFPTLEEWGIAGVKFGFVQFKTHRWATWVHDLVKLAARYHLMVNIHDEFRPSGFSRTYPNLLTQEGICGNEEFPDATHNTILPFTRMINGAADYTICYYDKRLKTTHAHQLAASVIFYSPLMTLFWYDRPSFYSGEKEVEFFETLPTVFDDTKVISGEPGKSAIIARRSADEWFVGGITNNKGSDETVKLNFLEKGKEYLARIYTDGDVDIKSKTSVRCTYVRIDSSQTLHFKLKPSGGVAIHILPLLKSEWGKYTKYKGRTI